MKKSITILGAGGKMGEWFAKYFTSVDYDVVGFDSDSPITDKSVKKAQSLVGAVLNADIVLLCTPTRRTPEIIRLIAKEKRGSFLIEISSQKAKTAASLLKIPAKITQFAFIQCLDQVQKRSRAKTEYQFQSKMQKKNRPSCRR